MQNTLDSIIVRKRTAVVSAVSADGREFIPAAAQNHFFAMSLAPYQAAIVEIGSPKNEKPFDAPYVHQYRFTVKATTSSTRNQKR